MWRSTIGNDESQLEEKLSLLAADHVMNANTSNTSDDRNDQHVVNIINVDASTDKPTYDPPTFIKLIHVQKNDVFYQTATAEIGRANSKFSINSNGLLVR